MFRKLAAGFVTGVCVLASFGTMSVMADDLYFVTGGPMGTYYAVGSAIADVLNPLLPESKLVIESSGASRANLEMIEEGDAQLGTVQNDVMYYASTGTSLFDGEDPYTNFSAVAGLYDETIQIITCDDAIRTVADLKGKKVSVGDAGSGVEFNAREILEAYGLSFDDIEVVNASFGDSANSLREGGLDAAFIVAGAPTAAVEELAENAAIGLVQLDEEHIGTLKENYNFYTDAVVPAGTYAGLEEDVVTVSVRATLVSSNEVSEDVVYNLLKAIFDNKDALAEKQVKFESLDAEEAVKGMSVPFHAGAKKYFEEQGITVD
jgi:TRAP transporter TAXI family solute receptor